MDPSELIGMIVALVALLATIVGASWRLSSSLGALRETIVRWDGDLRALVERSDAQHKATTDQIGQLREEHGRLRDQIEEVGRRLGDLERDVSGVLATCRAQHGGAP